MQEDAVSELQKRIGVSVPVSNSNAKRIVDVLEDTELLELASKFTGEGALSNKEVIISLSVYVMPLVNSLQFLI